MVAACRCGGLYGPGLWLVEGSLCGECECERAKAAAARRAWVDEERTCARCGATFRAAARHQKHCSAACRRAAWREMRRQGVPAYGD